MNPLAETPSLQVNKHKDAKVCWKHNTNRGNSGWNTTTYFVEGGERIRPSHSQFHQTTLIMSDVVEKESDAPVARKMDNAIHRINLYPLDSAIGFLFTYQLDSDLSGG